MNTPKPSPRDSNPEKALWTASAARWTENAADIASATAGATRVLLDRLRPEGGERVLDVASGAGDPALTIAERVGPGGHVTASDMVAAMLETLARRAAERGITWLTTVHAAAEDLDIKPGSHDAACCRFGSMFFSDPERALASVARAVRPGGRMVFVVWAESDRNPFLALAPVALDDAGIPPLSLDPDEKGPFEFAEPGRLADLCRAAGWSSVDESEEPFEVRLPEARPKDFLDVRRRVSARMGERLEGQAARLVEAARRLLAERVAPYARGGGLVLPSVVRVVTGRA